MTYLEKYKMDHPGLSDDAYRSFVIGDCPKSLDGRTIHCPADLHGLMCTMSNQERCPICWNREIPGTKPTSKTKNNEREDKKMNKNFTKADLKVGYVVRYRNGNLRMVMPYAGGLVFTAIDGQWLNISTEINDDLTAVPWPVGPQANNSLDVMEVYGLNRYGNSTLHISTENRELLWKREEKKPVKKMTVSEIEKALGYKVEVVAEEK